jgi:cytidylate kinase
VQSGGRELARRLAERLGYKCMSREVITQCARKYNIIESELYERLMEAPNLWKRLTKTHRRYLIYIQCSLIEAARQDNVIYHGYAGQLFLQGVKHALKVRLEAPFEQRVQAEMKEYDKSQKDAEEYIRHMDDQRNRWVKFLYGKEWNDPSFYDVSINLQNISIDTVCDMIATAVASPAYETTENSVRILNNLSLACEVEAALASDDALWSNEIKVSAEGSVVTLQGVVKNAKVRDAIVATTSHVRGVSECRSLLRLLSDPVPKGAFGD